MRWASWYYWHANQRFFECQKIMSVWQAPCFVIMTVNINLMKRILRNFEYNYYQGEICRKTIPFRDLFYRCFYKWDERDHFRFIIFMLIQILRYWIGQFLVYKASIIKNISLLTLCKSYRSGCLLLNNYPNLSNPAVNMSSLLHIENID